jgi:NitT/TauT family transport system permease protein
MKWKKNKKEKLIMVLWVLFFLALWQVSATLGGVSSLVLPTLGEVGNTLLDSVVNGNLLIQIYYSLKVIVIGMIIATVLALILSLAAQRYLVMAGLGKVLALVGHPLPALALLPLIIVWFGTGDASIIAIIVHSALWPIMINLTEGFAAVPPIYLEIGRNMELSHWAMTWEIRMKSALGYFISGLKIAFARSWRALIGAEMVFGAIGLQGGIGWYIFKQRTFMNTPGLFVGILVVIIIGFVVESVLFQYWERKTIRKWNPTV